VIVKAACWAQIADFAHLLLITRVEVAIHQEIFLLPALALEMHSLLLLTHQNAHQPQEIRAVSFFLCFYSLT
jgi:hypothetical protein